MAGEGHFRFCWHWFRYNQPHHQNHHFNAHQAHYGLYEMAVCNDISCNEDIVEYAIDAIVFGNHVSIRAIIIIF